jgi:hypothetical protein
MNSGLNTPSSSCRSVLFFPESTDIAHISHTIRAKDCVDGDINIGPYCAIDSISKVVAVSDFDNRYVLGFQYNGSLRWKCEVEGGPRGLMKMGNELLVSDNYGQEICAISVDSGKFFYYPYCSKYL